MPLGSSSPRSPLVMALALSSPLQADDLFLDSETLPPVLTATRLKQSPAAAPGSASLDAQQTARHSGSADSDHEWNSARLYYSDEALNDYGFERVDTCIAKHIRLGKANLELAGVLEQRLINQPTCFVDNHYDERRVMHFSAELAF